MAGLLGDERDVALVAVGSFGRDDRAPHSDLDIVLVHRGRSDIASVANRVWYPIWDRGLSLDHSVRTVKEALAVAGDDLKAALGLLDGRHIAGDRRLAAELIDRSLDHWKSRARRRLPELRDAVLARQERFGDIASLLEPEIKEGKGGLRDVHALQAAARGTPVLDDVVADVVAPYRELLAIRGAAHVRAGRNVDRLLLQDQDVLADDLGVADADALMRAVSTAAGAIAYLGDDGWQRVDRWLADKRGRAIVRDRPLASGVVLRQGEVVITGDLDAGTALSAAAVAARSGHQLARSTLARLDERMRPPPEPWPRTLLQALIGLLGAGDAAIPVIASLDHYGLMERMIPEWGAVRHKPQRNAYHRFTVDRHLLEAVARAVDLTRDVARPDLLLLGALLHDIGKGFPGDHTEAGIAVIDRIGARLGLPAADIAVLEALIRHHLLLPEVATRRDLGDPATIERVAEAVGDVETLELLAALTEADSLATGSAAWSEWKAGLVDDLVRRTTARLDPGRRGQGATAGEQLPPLGALAHGRADGLHVLEPGRLLLLTRDQPGVLSSVAGVLALHGLEVLAAQAGPAEDGRAVDVIDVVSAFGQTPDWARVTTDLEEALSGRLVLERKLADRARTYTSRYRTRSAARPAEPRVLWHLDASDRSTVIEVRAADGVAVLHRITRALADEGLDVRSARVATLGHEVVDSFYVADGDGRKVTDPERLRSIEGAVLTALRTG